MKSSVQSVKQKQTHQVVFFVENLVILRILHGAFNYEQAQQTLTGYGKCDLNAKTVEMFAFLI